MMYKRHTDFEHNRTTLENDPRVGRPESSVVPDTSDAVKKLFEADRHKTYLVIETCLGISAISVHKIFHEDLGVRSLV